MEDMNSMVNKAMIQPHIHKDDCRCGLCLKKLARNKVGDQVQSTKRTG